MNAQHTDGPKRETGTSRVSHRKMSSTTQRSYRIRDLELDLRRKSTKLKGLARETFRWPTTVIVLLVGYSCVYGLSSAHGDSQSTFSIEGLKLEAQDSFIIDEVSKAWLIVGYFVGAFVADSFTGKFVVLAVSSVLLVFSSLLFAAVSSLCGMIDSQAQRSIYITSVVTSSIFAFGQPLTMVILCEQFPLPRLSRLETFFIYQYAIGSFLEAFFSAAFDRLGRAFDCFSCSNCFAALFYTEALALACFAVLLFTLKSRLNNYTPYRPIVIDIIRCIYFASKQKSKNEGSKKKKHLFWALSDRYDKDFIDDIYQLKNLSIIVSLGFFYYVLFEEIYLTYQRQAKYLDGSFGNYFHIQPGHIIFFNQLGVALFAPFVRHVILPQLKTYGVLKTQLQRLGVGYSLAFIAFLMAGALQHFIERNRDKVTNNQTGQLRFFNTQGQSFVISSHQIGSKLILPYSTASFLRVKTDKEIHRFHLKLMDQLPTSVYWSGEVEAIRGFSVSYIVMPRNLVRVEGKTVVKDSPDLSPRVFLFCGSSNCSGNVTFLNILSKEMFGEFAIPGSPNFAREITLSKVGKYNTIIQTQNKTLRIRRTFKFENGSVYACLFFATKSLPIRFFDVYAMKNIHILWMAPQFSAITLSELMTMVSLNVFIFTESPTTMRSLSRALYFSMYHGARLFAYGVGGQNREEQSRFFLWAVVAFLLTSAHVILASRYKYSFPQK